MQSPDNLRNKKEKGTCVHPWNLMAIGTYVISNCVVNDIITAVTFVYGGDLFYLFDLSQFDVNICNNFGKGRKFCVFPAISLQLILYYIWFYFNICSQSFSHTSRKLVILLYIMFSFLSLFVAGWLSSLASNHLPLTTR